MILNLRLLKDVDLHAPSRACTDLLIDGDDRRVWKIEHRHTHYTGPETPTGAGTRGRVVQSYVDCAFNLTVRFVESVEVLHRANNLNTDRVA